jgi:phosphoglycolate phosphatase
MFNCVVARTPLSHSLSNSHGPERIAISHVIFDFDGTLSWLRSGWPDLMVELFSTYLPIGKSSAMLCRTLRSEILALNGKPSIYQVRWFCEVAEELKFSTPDPETLHALYLSRLRATVGSRVESLANAKVPAECFLIAGVRPLLGELRRRDLHLIILSGTAECEVRREAELLGLSSYFGPHIYGSAPGRDFSKKDIIDRILREEGIDGAHLLSFGDGPIEIQFTKAVGGFAIGVASDEQTNGSGVMDSDKREQLQQAGADFIIPDYQDLDFILQKLFT